MLVLLEKGLFAILPLSSTQKLCTIDCGLAPTPAVMHYPHSANDTSGSSSVPRTSHSPADRVPCDTVRLQVEPPDVPRERMEVHQHFSLSVIYVDRRQLGREEDGCMRGKAQFRCTRHAGRGRKSIIGLRSGNSVSHLRVETSAL